MKWLSFVYVAVLFFILTPGILVSLPPKSSKWIVALVHAVVYTVILTFTYHPVSKVIEGGTSNNCPCCPGVDIDLRCPGKNGKTCCCDQEGAICPTNPYTSWINKLFHSI